VAYSFGHGNEFWGFVKDGEFRDHLRDMLYGVGYYRMETLLDIKCN